MGALKHLMTWACAILVAAIPVTASAAWPERIITLVAPFPAGDLVLLVGRDGHPFRRRERQQLLALARIADRIAALVD